MAVVPALFTNDTSQVEPSPSRIAPPTVPFPRIACAPAVRVGVVTVPVTVVLLPVAGGE